MTKAAEKAAEEYQADDTRTKLGPKNSFLAGVDWVLKFLTESSDEFDESALKEYDKQFTQYENGIGTNGIRYRCLLEGARFQHSLDQAKIAALRAEVARSKEFEHMYKELCK